MSTTEALPGLAPWVESIQAIKDDVDESAHILTVFGLAMLEMFTPLPLEEPAGSHLACRHLFTALTPMAYHAAEVLEHHGLVTVRPSEAPDWYEVRVTDLGRSALAQAKADREADIADREGRMR